MPINLADRSGGRARSPVAWWREREWASGTRARGERDDAATTPVGAPVVLVFAGVRIDQVRTLEQPDEN